MPTYRFKAVDAKGVESSGSVDAGSEAEAQAAIRGSGLFPTSVVVAGGKASKEKAVKAARGKTKPKKAAPKKKKGTKKKGGGGANIQIFPGKVKPDELVVFTRQLATLVDAGLPLVRGLEVLDKQETNPAMKKAIGSMVEAISSGSTFAEAMSQHPKIFDRLYVNMVKAGELGGVLDTVLLSLSVFMEKAQKIKNKVVSAMVYPCVVLFMAICIVIFLMVFIIPKFAEIFDDILDGKPLPGLTRFVMGISNGITSNLPYTIAGIVILVFAFKITAKTRKGRHFFDVLQLKMPPFGKLFLMTGIARFTRTFGTLMDSGVPVLQALTIVRETTGNMVIANAIGVVHDAVKEGENISPPMESTDIFPPMVIGMVEVGEETGELPQMLSRIADNYEDEVDNIVASITSIIEPIMIVGLALIVGTIVIALFMPLISIITDLTAQ